MHPIEKMLKQNPPHADGSPGSWKFRFGLSSPKFKAQFHVVGLSTTNREEAIHRAWIVISTLRVLGLPITKNLVAPDGSEYNVAEIRPTERG